MEKILTNPGMVAYRAIIASMENDGLTPTKQEKASLIDPSQTVIVPEKNERSVDPHIRNSILGFNQPEENQS